MNWLSDVRFLFIGNPVQSTERVFLPSLISHSPSHILW